MSQQQPASFHIEEAGSDDRIARLSSFARGVLRLLEAFPNAVGQISEHLTPLQDATKEAYGSSAVEDTAKFKLVWRFRSPHHYFGWARCADF